MSNENLTLCVPRPSSGQNPHQPVIVRSQKPVHCPPNHVLIQVDRFGFSANNITYQALGEHPHFRYFEFHLAPEGGTVSPKTHGLFPVWGFGTVVKSTHPKILQGERVYGYLAPTRYLLLPVSPADVHKHAFYVPRPHLPADRRPYNQILRCATDSQYIPTSSAEDLTMLYRPLFWTSYWCEDWLYSSSYRGGATTILISSASSKTAFCLAYLIQKRISHGEASADLRVIGLTSKGNMEFTKGLGLYHEVLEYSSFTSGLTFQAAGAEKRWVYVDVASNNSLNQRILDHFASPQAGTLVACIVLGLTTVTPASSNASTLEWNHNTFTSSTTGHSNTSAAYPASPKFENFFMVEWLNIRKHQLSPSEILGRQDRAWKELMQDCPGWVKIDCVRGGDAVKQVYEAVTKKGLGPDKGLIWSLWDEENRVPAKL